LKRRVTRASFFGRDRLEYKIQRIDRAVRTSDERLKRQ